MSRGRRRVALVLLIASVGYFLLLADVVLRGRLRELDLVLLEHTPEVTDNWQTHTAAALARAGAWQLQAGVVLAVAALLSAVRRRRGPLLQGVAALLLVAVVVGATKALITRPDPWTDRLDAERVGGAFPSGHVAGAVVLGLLLPLLVAGGTRWSRLLLGTGMVWPAVMAWSRLHLYVHWLTDVIGGLLVGLAAVAAARLLAGPERPEGTS